MIEQLLNSVRAKYRDFTASRRSIICPSLQLRQVTDLLATGTSRCFPQPRPIIVNYLGLEALFHTGNDMVSFLLFNTLNLLRLFTALNVALKPGYCARYSVFDVKRTRMYRPLDFKGSGTISSQ